MIFRSARLENYLLQDPDEGVTILKGGAVRILVYVGSDIKSIMSD